MVVVVQGYGWGGDGVVGVGVLGVVRVLVVINRCCCDEGTADKGSVSDFSV